MGGVMRRDSSIAANAIVPDQLAADLHPDSMKTASMRGFVLVYATQSATGLRLDFKASNRILGQNVEPFISSTGPLLDGQHFLAKYPVLAGEVISMGVSNTTGGALTLRYHVEVP